MVSREKIKKYTKMGVNINCSHKMYSLDGAVMSFFSESYFPTIS